MLKVLKPEGAFSSHCVLSNSVPRKDDILMAISHRHNSESVIVLGDVRAIGERTCPKLPNDTAARGFRTRLWI
ncbi:hypothetical protein CASFOL_003335 [Castilleja foliolosa]|uniref:Uncharacterized protein n=1 Tax=Castilleja foliolosa TaxID=1961234 RepID=A0ABD3EHB7_9LAMI